MINAIDIERTDEWIWNGDSKTGHMHYTGLITGTFFESFELQLFPFDANCMHFIVRSSISPRTIFVESRFEDYMEGKAFFLLCNIPGFKCDPEKSSLGYFHPKPDSSNMVRAK